MTFQRNEEYEVELGEPYPQAWCGIEQPILLVRAYKAGSSYQSTQPSSLSQCLDLSASRDVLQ